MKRLMSAGLFALVSIIPAFTAPAEDATDPLANAPTQYSADLVVTRKVGQQTPMTMKIYVDGNKRRTETGATGNVIILRGDLSKRYVLTPSGKTYMEAPLDPRVLESPNEWAKRMGLVHEKVGTEDVNGETSDKYSYASDPKKSMAGQNKPAMPAARAVTGFIWVGQKTHMLVKSENEVTSAEWKNIKIGPPDASLFELPADYKKIEAGRPFQMQPQAQKSEEQKSEEQKSGGQSPSPTPAVSASPEASVSPEASPSAQKSDGDK
jgi:outer membrane lipoprotein-sorting protein